MKICWVITGAGHFLTETADFLYGIRNTRSFGEVAIDLFFTRAAVEVSARYGKLPIFEACGFPICRENDYSSSGVIYFAGGRYDALVIAPATANTVAKCALGIADSLASNFFAQGGKIGVPIFVLPTDGEENIVSVTPSGRKIEIRPRPVDLARLGELSRYPGVTILRSPNEYEIIFGNLK